MPTKGVDSFRNTVKRRTLRHRTQRSLRTGNNPCALCSEKTISDDLFVYFRVYPRFMKDCGEIFDLDYGSVN
jgi:hypothetical protein